MNKIGRGVTPLSMAIVSYLAAEFNKTRRRALLDWEVKDASRVPQIKTFSPFDDVTFTRDNQPLLTVDVRRALDFMDVDRTAGEQGSKARYATVVTLWVMSPETVEGQSETQPQWRVTQIRNDMAAIVRQCLLSRPSLGTEHLELNIRTYSEEYVVASPTSDASQRYQAAVQFSFDLLAEEWVTDTKLGEARVIEVDVESESLSIDEDEDPFNLGKLRNT